MAAPRVLVAGGTGSVGGHLLQGLLEAGVRVRAIVRNRTSVAALDYGVAPRIDWVDADLTRPDTLRGICDGVDLVASAAGAPLDFRLTDRAGFESVDYRGNLNLLSEAERSGVSRFVYVSLFVPPGLRTEAAMRRRDPYVDAHERFVRALRRSGGSAVVIRPTGCYSSFAELITMARRGRVPLVGSGEARTNPVHEADVAKACCEAAARLLGRASDAGPWWEEVPAGGPAVYSRRDLAEMAIMALGGTGRTTSVPPGVLRAAASVLAPLHPRVAALVGFGAAIGVVDCVAPIVGARPLEHYFEERVSAMAAS